MILILVPLNYARALVGETAVTVGGAVIGGALTGGPIGLVAGGLLGLSSVAFSSFTSYLATLSIQGVFAIIQYVLAVVLMVAGSIFDKALSLSIYKFHDFASMEGINIIWRVSRDLSNMVFIFIMLYIAIGTILQLQKVDYKKMIPAVIVAALLINFSAAIAKVIIDPTNILAAEIYQKMANFQSEPGAYSPYKTGITGIFMNGLKLTKIYDIQALNASARSGFQGDKLKEIQQSGEGKDKPKVTSPGGILVAGVGSSILLLVTAFVFFAGAVLFIIRTVSLLFIIALAPFAFLFPLIPMLKQHSDKWWNVLIDQSIFAPIYMLLIYFVALLVNSNQGGIAQAIGINKVQDAGPLADWFGGSGESTIYFLMLIFFMLAAMIIAKKMGAMGTDIAGKVGKWATGGLVGAGMAGIGGASRLAKWAAPGTTAAISARASAYATRVTSSPVGKVATTVGKYAASTAPGKMIIGGASHPLETASSMIGGLTGTGGFITTAGERRTAEKEAKEAEKSEKEEKQREKNKADTASLKEALNITDIGKREDAVDDIIKGKKKRDGAGNLLDDSGNITTDPNLANRESPALSDQELEKLDYDIMAKSEVARRLPAIVLSNLLKADKRPTSPQRQKIRNAIVAGDPAFNWLQGAGRELF